MGVNGIILGNVASSEGAEPVLAQGGSPGKKDETNFSTSLPKVVAAERSSQATTAGGGARATNCKSDLEVFRAFVKAGERLADLHVNYEEPPEYPLQKIEKTGEKLDWHVEKMRLSRDKTSITYNQFLTLSGIPPETFQYRLGNRCALEWVIDQYQISKDKRSGIVNDPNRADDEQYIVRLIGQVITVSLETMKVVKSLPDLGLPAEAQAATAGPS